MTGHFDDEGVAAAFRAMFTERSGDVPMSPAPYTRLRRRIVHARRQRRLRAGGAAVALVVAAAGAGAWAAAGRSGGAATVPATPSSKGTKYTYDDGVTALADGRAGQPGLAPCLAETADRYLRQQGFDLPADSGYTVVTTFDQPTMAAAAVAAAERLWAAKEGPGAIQKDTHLSFTVLDPKTGQVRAVYDGVDGVAGCQAGRGGDAMTGHVQIGQLMFPVVVATALQHGYTVQSKEPADSTRVLYWPIGSVGDQNKLQYVDANGHVKLWPPQAPDQTGPTHTLTTLTDALVNGNASAMADLEMEPDVTPAGVFATAQDLGLNADRNASDFDPVPSLCAGVTATSPLTMASAYGTLANDGRRRTPVLVTEVRDAAGKVVWRPKDDTAQALPPQTAAAVQGALHDVVSGRIAPADQSVRALLPSVPDLAGEFATTDYDHSAWFAGSGGGLTVAVAMWRQTPSGIVESLNPSGQEISGVSYPSAVAAALLARLAQTK